MSRGARGAFGPLFVEILVKTIRADMKVFHCMTTYFASLVKVVVKITSGFLVMIRCTVGFEFYSPWLFQCSRGYSELSTMYHIFNGYNFRDNSRDIMLCREIINLVNFEE